MPKTKSDFNPLSRTLPKRMEGVGIDCLDPGSRFLYSSTPPVRWGLGESFDLKCLFETSLHIFIAGFQFFLCQSKAMKSSKNGQRTVSVSVPTLFSHLTFGEVSKILEISRRVKSFPHNFYFFSLRNDLFTVNSPPLNATPKWDLNETSGSWSTLFIVLAGSGI